MYAVIETGSKQYIVKPGDELKVELLSGVSEKGQDITFDNVLMVSDENSSNVAVAGKSVAGAKVTAKLINIVRGPKLIAFKKIRRHGKQCKKGHRQDLCHIQITGIQTA